MKICSFFSSATEIICELGLGDQLVARSDQCNYPPAVQKLPTAVQARIKSDTLSSKKIEDAVNEITAKGEPHYLVNTRLLNRLRPDLIIADELCAVCAPSHPQLKTTLDTLDYEPSVTILNTANFEAVFETISQIGEVTGTRKTAEAIVTRLRLQVQKVRDRLKGVTDRPRVFCMEWLDPIWVAGHWVPEMVQMAGGEDGLGRPQGKSYRVSWDEVLKYKPEVIFVMPCSFKMERIMKEGKTISHLPGWKDLPAVQENRVWALESDYVHRPGPRLVKGLEIMASLIHPEHFETPQPSEAKRLTGHE
jgi:iron complex transport system substrate-binding protein